MAKTPLAILAGTGHLPQELAQAAIAQGHKVVVVGFAGFAPDWAQQYSFIPATFEKPGAVFKALKSHGCVDLVMAGAMSRPHLNPLKFDRKMLGFAAKLLPALKRGDNDTLGLIKSLFEAEGFNVIGAHEVLTDLLCPTGCLTKTQPSKDDLADIARARDITAGLGALDVGQAAVVAQGLCLGLESIQGSDVLLSFVALACDNARPDPKGAKGVFVKAPKPSQDRALDLPTIGPDTLTAVQNAGLAGIGLEAGGVLIVDRDKTIALADDLGLFIYGFDA